MYIKLVCSCLISRVYLHACSVHLIHAVHFCMCRRQYLFNIFFILKFPVISKSLKMIFEMIFHHYHLNALLCSEQDTSLQNFQLDICHFHLPLMVVTVHMFSFEFKVFALFLLLYFDQKDWKLLLVSKSTERNILVLRYTLPDKRNICRDDLG